jgi:hypothetical protein
MYSADIVFTAIKMIDDKLSFNKIGKLLNISRQIVSIWNNKYKNHFDDFKNKFFNKIKNNNNNNNNKSYPINIINYIIRLIKINPHLNRKEIINNVKTNLNVKLNISDIRNIYKTAKIVKKKIRKLVAKNEDFLDELHIKRNNFINNISNYDINKIISFDEAGFNHNDENKYGYGFKGKQLIEPTNTIRSKNISLLMAITTTDIINKKLYESTINTNIVYPPEGGASR